MIVYIAGAMTGKFKYKEDFERAERYIRGLGHIAVNPAFLPEGLQHYFEINKAMIDQCNAIYVLRGSKDSVGTQKEIEYCKSKGWSMESGNILYENEDHYWLPTPEPYKVPYTGAGVSGLYGSGWRWWDRYWR